MIEMIEMIEMTGRTWRIAKTGRNWSVSGYGYGSDLYPFWVRVCVQPCGLGTRTWAWVVTGGKGEGGWHYPAS